MLISNNLYEKVLLEPMQQGLNRLRIVTGYATAAMAFKHLQYARENGLPLNVQLLVGMPANDGISDSNHQGFKQLVENDFQGSLECSYIYERPAVHSKVYTWLADDKPACSFVGSANYTQNAFGETQQEVMTLCDAGLANHYCESFANRSIYCTHNDVATLIQIYQDRRTRQQDVETGELPAHLVGLENVQVSLLGAQGEVQRRSGLNWGQRPEAGRDPNQAYIALRHEVYRTNFFPPRTVHFTVLTDDGKTLICTRAQDEGKGIHTPHNNALLGEYFRNRLGIASGAEVTEAHLNAYRRDYVVFYKIDDETYYMDFSR